MGRLEDIVQQQLLSLIAPVSPQDIDLWTLADCCDLSVIASDTQTGLFEDKIFLDYRNSFEDQRVDLAHELCHFIMHVGNQLFLPTNLMDDQEKQAHRMSLYLLCPTDMLQAALNGFVFRSREEVAPFVASMFNVPLWFAKQRMQTFMVDTRSDHAPQLGRDYDTVWEHPATGRRIYFKHGQLVKGGIQ